MHTSEPQACPPFQKDRASKPVMSSQALLAAPMAAVSAPATGHWGMETCASCHRAWNPHRVAGVRCRQCSRVFHAECAFVDSSDVSPDMFFVCVRCGQDTPDSTWKTGHRGASAQQQRSLKLESDQQEDESSETSSQEMTVDATDTPMFVMDDFTEEEAAVAATLTEVARGMLRPMACVSPVPSTASDPDMEAIRTLGMLKLSQSLPTSTIVKQHRTRPRSRNRTVAKPTASPADRPVTAGVTKVTTRPRAMTMPDNLRQAAKRAVSKAIKSESRERSNSLSKEKSADKSPVDHKRMFHNERERQRRSTIRNLFDGLRKSVPSLEALEGTSDRQILLEAAKHIEDLSHQSDELEEALKELRAENARLRKEKGCPPAPEQTEAEGFGSPGPVKTESNAEENDLSTLLQVVSSEFESFPSPQQ